MKNKKTKKNQLGRIAIFVVVFCFSFVFINQDVFASEITEENITRLVNESRSLDGMESLVKNCDLNAAAKEKIFDMFQGNYFSHNSPDGLEPWYWIEKNGYDYKYAGENLAINFTDAESQHEAWMESPTHKKNIMNSNYKEIGIAIERGIINGKFSTVTVQMFGGRKVDASDVILGDIQAEKEISCEDKEIKSVLFGYTFDRDEIQKTKTRIEPKRSDSIYVSQKSARVQASQIVNEETAAVSVFLIIVVAVILNVSLVSKVHHGSSFTAINSVIILIILTSLVFWKI